jgi:plasmid replication initiation protein
MVINKKKSLLTSLIVTQSNQLVEARYNLPLAEQRLILTMISRIQPDDEDFKPYRISVGELAEFLGVDKASAYRECKKTTENLLKRVVNIDEADGLLQIGWVSSAKYIDGSGMVNLSFDPLLKPYLLKLKGNFTSSKLEMLLSFKSQYTIRIYTLLKQYEKLKDREFELEKLREVLGLRKEQYQLYADFKRFILLSVQKELIKKSDIYFEFEEIKYGRRVGAIRFKILTNKFTKHGSLEVTNTEKTETIGIPEDLLSLIPERHRLKKTIASALELYENKHGFNYVKRNILYSNEKADKSYAGFLSKALKEDWGHDWELDQQQSLTSKKPLEVWERQGFKTEKEYNEFMFQKQMDDYKKVTK